MRTIMRDTYRNDSTSRARLLELSRLRTGKNREAVNFKKNRRLGKRMLGLALQRRLA